MAASQSLTVHSKTHRVCPIRPRNIGPIGPLSSTRPSPWIKNLSYGRTDMTWMIQRATVPGKWLRSNHVWFIQRPTGSVLSTQKILDSSVHYSVLDHHLESQTCPCLIWHGWFKELLYQENGCVPIKCDTFQDPPGQSYPHKKYWTNQSFHYPVLDTQLESSPYSTGRSDVTLNQELLLRKVWYYMNDSKSYCTRKMAASQSRTIHSKTLSSTIDLYISLIQL